MFYPFPRQSDAPAHAWIRLALSIAAGGLAPSKVSVRIERLSLEKFATFDGTKFSCAGCDAPLQEVAMDRVTRCLQCGKRMVPAPSYTGRTELKCVFCDRMGPMEMAEPNKLAESALVAPVSETAP